MGPNKITVFPWGRKEREARKFDDFSFLLLSFSPSLSRVGQIRDTVRIVWPTSEALDISGHVSWPRNSGFLGWTASNVEAAENFCPCFSRRDIDYNIEHTLVGSLFLSVQKLVLLTSTPESVSKCTPPLLYILWPRSLGMASRSLQSSHLVN